MNESADMNSIDVCLWSMDVKQENVFQISASCERIYGYSEVEFIIHPNLWREAIHPLDLEEVEKRQQGLSQGKAIHHQYRIIDRFGKVKWVSDYTKPVFGKHGELMRVDGVIMDISHMAAEK